MEIDLDTGTQRPIPEVTEDPSEAQPKASGYDAHISHKWQKPGRLITGTIAVYNREGTRIISGNPHGTIALIDAQEMTVGETIVVYS